MRGIVREIVITIVLALLFFVAIRSVVHNFEVNGHSMEPTLHDGQFVIVSKATYWFGDPKRGDIVVFDDPSQEHDIIHRIIGLPGEIIEIRDGQLYIDGDKFDEPYTQGTTNVPRQQIPDDKYFIIGDNRGKATVDLVSRDAIVGKAWFIYWPLSDWGFVSNHSWKSDEKNEETPEPSAKIPICQNLSVNM